MSDTPLPAVTAGLRIAQSTLTDTELAYIYDLMQYSATTGDNLKGWSINECIRKDEAIAEACLIRGIENGVRVVTQTVDLRS